MPSRRMVARWRVASIDERAASKAERVANAEERVASIEERAANVERTTRAEQRDDELWCAADGGAHPADTRKYEHES